MLSTKITGALSQVIAVLVLALAILSFSSTAVAIKKCIDSSGNVTYTNQSCQSGSKAERIDSKRQVAQPTVTPSSSQDSQCVEMNKARTTEEMIARAEAIRRGEIPEGEICCRNGKVVQCEGTFGVR